MKPSLISALVALVLALASCKFLAPEITSQDCVVAVPAGSTRIFIGMPAHGGQQSGTSFEDPLDGSTAEKFDTILRTISEGQHPTWGTQTNIAPENLIVCLTSGTFQTNGQYDWNIVEGHTQGSNLGFTLEKNWKIHGRSPRRTTLQLASFAPRQFVVLNSAPINGGSNVVLGTHSSGASGIEISDLTLDANHDRLPSPGGLPLNLAGIVLRSNNGGHWIHNVAVIGASGDVGFSDIRFEAFAVQIWGNLEVLDPTQSTNNLIENVTVSKPGSPVMSGAPAGGVMDGIVVNNAVAEIRDSLVEDYTIAFGGWAMGPVWFHGNTARNVKYGFNADSFTSAGVIFESNQIIHPLLYGIVIGGGNGSSTFQNWKVSNNSIQLNQNNSVGLVLRGQVQDSVFSGNTIASDGSAKSLIGIWSYPIATGLANFGNGFQDNRIDNAMSIDFSLDPNFNGNCRFQNRDLQGKARQDFPDNSSTRCR